MSTQKGNCKKSGQKY